MYMICDLASEQKGKFYCRVLAVPMCPGTACAFYKTRERARRDKERANARLRSLPHDQQLGIADEYYKGRIKW